MSEPEPSKPSTWTPFVSVIVPIYNGADGVAGLLDALNVQDYPKTSFEVLVVDNGSSDDTIARVEQFAAAHPSLSLRVLKEHERRGSYAARNKGVSEAKGEVFAFTDGDCRPIPGWLTAGVQALSGSGVDQVAGGVEFYFANTPPNVWECVDSLIHLRQDLYVRDNQFGVTANLFVKAAPLKQVGAFRDTLKSGGDFEFGQRMKAAGFGIVYAPHAKILHAARDSRDELLSKVRRVSGGLDTLASEGQVPPVRIKDLKPRLRPPRLAPELRGGFARPLAVLLALNYVHYNRLLARAEAVRRRAPT